MKVDYEKLKKTSIDDILDDISMAEKEISNVMHPTSWARTKELIEYKRILLAEYIARKQNMN